MSARDERDELAAVVAELAHLRKDRDAFRDQRNGVFQTNRKLLAEREEEQVARLRAENETRTVKREADALRARVAELEARDAALLTVMERVRDASGDVMGTYDKPSAPGCSVWGLLSDLAVVRGLNRAPEHNQWSGAPYPDEPDDGAFEEASTHAEFVLPPDSGRRTAWRMLAADEPEDVAPQLQTFGALLAGQRAEVGDPHDSPLHHEYQVPRDLPETGGERSC